MKLTSNLQNEACLRQLWWRSLLLLCLLVAGSQLITVTANRVQAYTSFGFASPTLYATGTEPYQVVVGDFNGDGKLDFASANYMSKTVTLRLNTGSAFGAAVDFPVISSPTSLVSGDFNGDGKLDLVTSGFGSINLILGDGTGNFGAASSFAAGSAVALVSGDFNNDGKLDIATANTNGTVSRLLNNGSGGFGPFSNFTVGASPQGIVAADFNGDGKLDLATANYDSNNVSILNGDGTGQFAAAVSFAASNGPSGIASGDFDNDGKPDLVTANFLGASVSVLLNNGSGGFKPAVNYNGNQTNIATGDFNGDGQLDFVTVNEYSSSISVRLGDGTGAFGSSQFSTGVSGTYPYGVAVGDFNGDNLPDVFTANISSNNVGVWRNISVPPTASINPVSGTPQSAVVSTTYSIPFSAVVKNLAGQPLSNTQVIFTAPASGASGLFSNSRIFTATTDTSGVATASNFTANCKPGTYTVTADAPGVSVPASFVLTNLTGAPVEIKATAGTPQNAPVNTNFATALQVQVKDSCANPVSGQAVTFSGPVAAGSSGGFFSGNQTSVTVNTDTNGKATAPVFTANTVTGSYVVSATLTNNPSLGSAAFNLTNLGGTPTTIEALAGTPQSSPGDTDFSIPFKVLVKDTYANPVNGINVVFSSPANGPGGSFNGNITTTVTTASGGIATAPVFTANCRLGNYSVTATVSGTSLSTAFNLTNLLGSVSRLDAASTGLQSTVINTAFTPSPKALVADKCGNPISGINVSFSAPASGPGGTFNGSSTASVISDNNGLAVAPTLQANNLTGAFTLKATTSVNASISASFSLFNRTATTNTNPAPVEFTLASSFDIGHPLQMLVTGDFNADGKPDLAGTDYFSGQATILLNNGSGGFNKLADIALGSSPGGLVTGDFNGDSKLDLVTINSANIALLLGNGNGTLQAPVSFSAGSQPGPFGAGDFNGDGKLDLVVGNGNTNNVTVLLGKGDGTFETPATINTSRYVRALTLADFNHDGKLDLAMSTTYDSSIYLMAGNGDGTFAAPTVIATAGTSGMMMLVNGDVNQDGNPDLVGLTLGTYGAVYVSLGNGNGTFQPVKIYNLRPFSYQTNLILSDLNNDAKPDVVVVNNYDYTASVLMGKGDGTFDRERPYITVGSPTSAVAIDFDGDNKTDLAISSNSTSMSLIQGNGTGKLNGAVSYENNSYTNGAVLGDLDGDDKPDLASGCTNARMGDGSGYFGNPTYYNLPTSCGIINLIDLTGDGKLDMVVFSGGTYANLRVVPGNGDGTFQATSIFTQFEPGSFPAGLIFGDFNGDGKLDMTVTNGNSHASASVWLGQGDGSFVAGTTFALSSDGGAINTGDFNGDGKLDLIIISGLINQVGIYLGNGDGTFTFNNNFGGGSTFTGIATGYFDNDTRLDLALATSGGIQILTGNGNGTFTAKLNYPATRATTIISSDFNGDGRFDLAFTDDGGLNIQLGKGDGTFASAFQLNAGRSPGIRSSLDINGDGRFDLGIANSDTNGAAVLVTHPPLPPSQLKLAAGDAQNAPLNSAFATRLKVRTLNSNNQPINNATVTFSAPASGPGASFSGAISVTVQTDGDGYAEAPALQANSQAGTYTITAILNDFPQVTPVSFQLTNVDNCNPLIVTADQDDGQSNQCGTLTQAINTALTSSQLVTITFSPAITRVTVTGALPVISSTTGIVIDGGCQSDANGRGVPGVQIVGSGANAGAFRLGQNVYLSGLRVGGFNDYLVTINGSNNRIKCSWLGTLDGTTVAGNSAGGIWFAGAGADNNMLGEADNSKMGLLIAGTNGPGIRADYGKNNWSYGSWIGWQANGTTRMNGSKPAVQVNSGAQLKFGPGNRF